MTETQKGEKREKPTQKKGTKNKLPNKPHTQAHTYQAHTQKGLSTLTLGAYKCLTTITTTTTTKNDKGNVRQCFPSGEQQLLKAKL